MTDIDTKPKVSLVDSNELSVLVPILGCRMNCSYCFNSPKMSDIVMSEEIIQDCLRFVPDIKTFTLGGHDVLGPNYFMTKKISSALKKKNCKIILQVKDLSSQRIERIEEINPDEISLGLNNYPHNLIHGFFKIRERFFVKTRLIYIPGYTKYPKEIPVDVVQQFIPGECLDPEYNKIPKPTRDEVMAFAKKIGANEIITQENGREKV